MPKLKAMPTRLSAAPGRLSAPPEGGKDRTADQTRAALKPWRKWYATARWRKLRRAILERDGWTCQATGVVLAGGRHDPNGPVVDHVVPHRGDPALFWDANNLRAVAKAWHDSEKQRQERAGEA